MCDIMARRECSSRAEFLIIPPAAGFVNRKMQQILTKKDPEICA
jgi:hypothetical protein